MSNRNSPTPKALTMIGIDARVGSFAAGARESGKVPSSLADGVRQLDDAPDLLLLDRLSRQARLTAASETLLSEGQRLLENMDHAVAIADSARRLTPLTVDVLPGSAC